MENLSVIIMEKDVETGFLNRELGSYSIQYDITLIDRIFASSDDSNLVINMYVTVQGNFEDWQFNAILDNYNMEVYDEKILSISEDEDSYNPTWLIKLNFEQNDDAMERKLNEILTIHSTELQRVIEEIKDMENEYKN